jgi:hypothetical protein
MTASDLTNPSRRHFWRDMLGHMAVCHGELHGIRHVSIGRISSLPDDEFMSLKFAVSETSVEWQDGRLHVVDPSGRAEPIACPMAEGRFLLTYVDGARCLSALVGEFAQEMKIDCFEARCRLRQVSESLIQAGVLVPRSPPP